EISLFYDPMVGKLIVHAPTREAAVGRMRRALLDLSVSGIETSRDFHLRVMDDGEFRSGEIDIQWLERRLPSLLAVQPPAETVRAATIAAAFLSEPARRTPTGKANGGNNYGQYYR